MQGIAFYETFKAMLGKWPQINQCLYLCEMLSWEKALLGAVAKYNPKIQTVGYQHTSISRNHFFYFHPSWKNGGLDARHSMPVPRILAANGRVTYELLSESGFEGLREVESLRHLHLETSRPSTNHRGKPVLLVAGSYNRREMENMLSLALDAFEHTQEIEVWLKGHPSCSFRDLRASFENRLHESNFRILEGDVSKYLPHAWAVLVATSTVSIEALAYGCQVLVPLFPDMICMCPLAGFEGLYESVRTPEELQCKIASLHETKLEEERLRQNHFIKKYWHLDPSLKRWNELLLS